MAQNMYWTADESALFLGTILPTLRRWNERVDAWRHPSHPFPSAFVIAYHDHSAKFYCR